MKVVAFDFDGTISNTFKSLNFCFEKVYRDFNRPFDEETLRSVLGANEEGICMKLFPTDYKKAFEDYVRYYKEYHTELVPPVDNKIFELLKEIKNDKRYHLVLLTGRHQLTTEISFDKLNLNGIFEKEYYGSIQGPNKVESFKKLFVDYCCKPEDVLYIGDSSKDVLACREVNVKIISANYYNPMCTVNLIKLNPNYLCQSVEKMVEEVKLELNM